MPHFIHFLPFWFILTHSDSFWSICPISFDLIDILIYPRLGLELLHTLPHTQLITPSSLKVHSLNSLILPYSDPFHLYSLILPHFSFNRTHSVNYSSYPLSTYAYLTQSPFTQFTHSTLFWSIPPLFTLIHPFYLISSHPTSLLLQYNPFSTSTDPHSNLTPTSLYPFNYPLNLIKNLHKPF